MENTEINPTDPIDDGTEPSGLSIDQPSTNVSAFIRPEYDGAPQDDIPAETVTTASGKKLLRLDSGDGTVYTAETERELLEKVWKGRLEANKHIKELKSQPPPAAASVTVPSPQKVMIAADYGDLPPGYDDQTYLNLLGTSPKKAAQYLNRELYGGLDPVQALNHAYSVANTVQTQMVGADFIRRNADFQPTPENADRLIAELAAQGISNPTIKDMEWTFSEMKRQGKIAAPNVTANGEIEYQDIVFGEEPPSNVTVMPERKPPAGPQRRGASAPRSAGGSNGAAVPAGSDDAYTMPLDQLRQQIENANAGLRRR